MPDVHFRSLARSRRPMPTLRYSPFRTHHAYPSRSRQNSNSGGRSATPASRPSSRNSASLATTGGAVSGEPRRCLATGQKCPPAPMTTGASIVSLAIHSPPLWRSVVMGVPSSIAHAGAAEQKVVELAPADRVADDAAVLRFDEPAADDAGPKGRDLLQREPGGAVLVGIEVEQREDAGCQPSRADLVPRKLGAIGEHDVPARTLECPRAGRARRVRHRRRGRRSESSATARGRRKRSARVQNGGADSRGVKITWNSCIHPVANAACDPARYSSQARANSSP